MATLPRGEPRPPGAMAQDPRFPVSLLRLPHRDVRAAGGSVEKGCRCRGINGGRPDALTCRPEPLCIAPCKSEPAPACLEMAHDKSREPDVMAAAPASPDDRSADAVGETQAVQKIHYSDSRKIGVTGAVFLILNKMIGTGSMSAPAPAPPAPAWPRLTRNVQFSRRRRPSSRRRGPSACA